MKIIDGSKYKYWTSYNISETKRGRTHAYTVKLFRYIL